MAKLTCKSNLLHNGTRYAKNDEIDTVDAKMDKATVEQLTAMGVVAEKQAPAKAPAKAAAKDTKDKDAE